jgi:hypothetical protein
MSVADKLLTIAENSRDMYLLAESKKATVRGSVAKADNVSGYGHSLGVKVSSNSLTDFSGIEVSRYGKNLVDLSKTPAEYNSRNYTFDIETGYYEVINAVAYAPNRWRFKVPTNTTIYLCASEVTNCNVQVSSVLQDGTDTINIGLQKGSFVYVNTGNYSELTLSIYASSAYDLISAKGIIVALYKTNYEPYKEPQTATANDADGTVEGLTSLSPNITLIPNNDGVSVECTYYTNERDPILEATENIKTALVELKDNL